MTNSDPIERARRAELLREEFLDPIMGDIRKSYAERIVEIAATELNPKTREQKITALSVAIRILDNVQQGLLATIMDGEIAHRNLIKHDKIEAMTAPQRRIFGLVPH